MHHTLIISYLFLGGAGAGALAVLSVLDMLSWQATVPGGGNATVRSAFYSPQAGYRDFFAPCYLISFISLALGTLCLLFDLGRADRALFLFLRPTLTYVSVGTYALTLCLLTAFVLCLIWGV
ncbi:MAG: polysulfide reductase, partial [Actinobacteria bacterium]|nr:polysulfide reductase [Actinomycetota bacterium]